MKESAHDQEQLRAALSFLKDLCLEKRPGVQGVAVPSERTHHHSVSPAWAGPSAFSKSSFHEGVICLPEMDHWCLGNNVPTIEQRPCLGPATRELKGRFKFRFGFLHVASLFALAHIFGDYSVQTAAIALAAAHT